MAGAWRALEGSPESRDRDSWSLSEFLDGIFAHGQEDPRTHFRESLVPDFLPPQRLEAWKRARNTGAIDPELRLPKYVPDDIASELTRKTGLKFVQRDGEAFILAGRGAAHALSIIARVEHVSELDKGLIMEFKGNFEDQVLRPTLFDVLLGPRFDGVRPGPWYLALLKAPKAEEFEVKASDSVSSILPPRRVEEGLPRDQTTVAVSQDVVERFCSGRPTLEQLWRVCGDDQAGPTRVQRFRALLEAVGESVSYEGDAKLRISYLPFPSIVELKGDSGIAIGRALWSDTYTWGGEKGRGREMVVNRQRIQRQTLSVQPRPSIVAQVQTTLRGRRLPRISKHQDLGQLLTKVGSGVRFVRKPDGEKTRFDPGEIVKSLLEVGVTVPDALSVVSETGANLRDEVGTEEIQLQVLRSLESRGLETEARRYAERFPLLRYVHFDDGSKEVLGHAVVARALRDVLGSYKMSAGETNDLREGLVNLLATVPEENRTFDLLRQFASEAISNRYASVPSTASEDLRRMILRSEETARILHLLTGREKAGESPSIEPAVSHMGSFLDEVVRASLLLLDHLPPANRNDAAIYLTVHLENEKENCAKQLGLTEDEMQLILDYAGFASRFESLSRAGEVPELVRAGFRALARKSIYLVSLLKKAFTHKTGSAPLGQDRFS